MVITAAGITATESENVMIYEDEHKLATAHKRYMRMGAADAWQILRDAYQNYTRNSEVNQAAAIAFYAILSLIPLFLLTLLVAGYFFSAHPQVQKDIAENIRAIHPFFSDDLLTNIVKLKEKRRAVGWIGIISLLWLSAMIFEALEKALNIIFRAKTLRNFVKSKLLAMTMIPLGWLVSITSVGVTYLATVLWKQSMLPKSGFLSHFFTLIPRYLLPYLLTVAFVALLYRIIPKARISLRGAVGGAVIFATLLEAAKYFFAWYIANYTNYDEIFGSMETVVLLVIWVFYVAMMLLFCAELISSYERRDMVLLEQALLMQKSKISKTDERLFRKFGRIYEPGEFLFQEGDAGQEMFYLLDGEVRVEKKAGQVTRTLAEIGAGAYLGEMAALIDVPRTASAYTLKKSYVAVISGDIFRDLLRESEAVSFFMLQEFSHRIKNTNDNLERVTQAWIRLLIVLYFQKEWPLAAGRDPWGELAALTEKTREEIDEIFSCLDKDGILEVRAGRVTSFHEERVGDILQVGKACTN
jgi:YihY family inner membrane protein